MITLFLRHFAFVFLRDTSRILELDHYGERKRPYTVVHEDLNGRERQTYDRLRTVNHPFGMGRITVARRRVVYGEKRTSFTLKSMP
jgi:hypothetical protein